MRRPIFADAERAAAFETVLRQALAHVRRFTAQFIGFDEFRDRNGIAGSGVFVRVGERLLVLTAAHNIDNGKVFPSAALLFVSETKPLDSVFTIMGGVKQGGKGLADEKWDVAVVEVPLAVLERTQREALPLERIDASWEPAADSTVVLFGLTDDGVVEGEDVTGLPEHCYATVPLSGQPIDATVREDIDVYFSYPKDMTMYRHGEFVPPHSPKGLSGGGVWAMPDDNPDSMRLVGLVVASHPRRDWVKAIRIGHVLARLKAYVHADDLEKRIDALDVVIDASKAFGRDIMFLVEQRAALMSALSHARAIQHGEVFDAVRAMQRLNALLAELNLA